jgi:hypothetical protein
MLYYHTLRHLRIVQIRYRLAYTIRGYVRQMVGFTYPKVVFSPLNYGGLLLLPSLSAARSVDVTGNTFSFLNQHVTFDTIDWNEARYGKLWTYNLTYFEFLHCAHLTPSQGLELIHDFISKIDHCKDGMEPYPISLRVIHTIKFLTYHNIQDAEIARSIYQQLVVLMDNLEYHILGNHLLENAFALLFGAYYFKDSNLYEKARQILEIELEEQVLEDGAHFELSPMYHQLMLYRVLDCYNMVKHNAVFAHDLGNILQQKAEIMLSWIQEMTFRNGEIPLFNDCAHHINPSTTELTQYADTLGLSAAELKLGESGYRKYANDNYEIVVDMGRLGPDYLPGHAHADVFSFVLQQGGQLIFTDTGTSTYNASPERSHERATQAHNTVFLSPFGQADMWGSFRVGKRSTPVLETASDNTLVGILAYTTTKAVHKRSFSFQARGMKIADIVEGHSAATAYFHLAPGLTPELTDEGVKIREELYMAFAGAKDIAITSYFYAPSFNTTQQAKRIEVQFEDKLDTEIYFQLPDTQI